MKRPPRTARNAMMDFLARRAHSELELRTKLRKHFTEDEINKALDFGREKGWIPTNAEEAQGLSGQFARHLHLKKKGIRAINHELKKKGLPPVEAESHVELEKAVELLKKKSKTHNPQTREGRAKSMRFLAARGFSSEVCRQAIQGLTKAPFEEDSEDI